MARELFRITGFEELQKTIAQLDGAMAGEEAQAELADVARDGRDMLKSNARSRNWPDEAIQSMFAYSKKAGLRSGTIISTLFGIRKRGRSRPYAPGYVEWGAGTNRKRPPYKNTPQKTVGESLDTMFEYGTSKMGARPAMRPTLTAMRTLVPARLTEAYKRIIERNTKG